MTTHGTAGLPTIPQPYEERRETALAMDREEVQVVVEAGEHRAHRVVLPEVRACRRMGGGRVRWRRMKPSNGSARPPSKARRATPCFRLIRCLLTCRS